MTTETKRVVGFFICWGCHQSFPLHEGERRRYCPPCVKQRQQTESGKRKVKA